ncbi:hypothetical protein SDC9_158627 [bioreactor metagenome]|uniref:Uncharacterized protein n=1 Tax=bioreactor metagenome TaxID=1076179 RepID=A0A645FCG6_9ZZZZ
MGGGKLQHAAGTVDVGGKGMHGIMHHQLHAHRRREMIDHVGFGDQGFERIQSENVAFDQREPGIRFQIDQVAPAAGGKIIDGRHAVFRRSQQFLGQMTADEPGAAGYQETHGLTPGLRRHFLSRVNSGPKKM